MARNRLNGIISGSTSIDAHLGDAMGGGLCPVHGKYFGHGRHGIRDCPKCDIDQYYSNQNRKSEEEFRCKNCNGKVRKSKFGGWQHVIATGCVKPQVSKEDWLIFLKFRKKKEEI